MTLKKLREISLILLSIQVIHVRMEQPQNIRDSVYKNHISYPDTGRRPDVNYEKGFKYTTMKSTRIPDVITIKPIDTSTQNPWMRSIDCKQPLGILKMSDMGLKRVTDGFLQNLHITELYLNRNEIEEVASGAFDYMPDLRLLDLSENKIPLDKLLWHGEQKNLEILKLDDNTGDADNNRLSTYFRVLPHLKELHLRGNRIIRLDLPFKSVVPRLTHLYLSGNNITSSKFINDLPATLRYLYVENNNITQMDVGVLERIHELYIDNNLLQEVCDKVCEGSSLILRGVSGLRKLSAAGNNISRVSVDAFQYVTSLTDLNLSWNKIVHLENDTLTVLKNLQDLNLAHNELTVIPSLCSLNMLKNLDLSGNEISDVYADSLCRLQNLGRLLLNDNRIKSIKRDAFFTLNGLQHLDLSNNRLTVLPSHWILPPENLRVLLLKNNRIANIEDLALQHMQFLKELHLQDNPLKPIRVNSLTHYPRDLLLYFHNSAKYRETYEEESDEDESDEDESNEISRGDETEKKDNKWSWR